MKRFQMVSFITLVLLLLVSCTPQATPAPAITPKVEPKASPKAEWQEKWDNILIGAKNEGKVVVYTSTGAEVRVPLANAFKEKFGLDLEFVIGSPAEVTRKLHGERTAGLYLADVTIEGVTQTLFENRTQGALDPLKPELLLPEVVDAKSWWGGSLPFIDNEGTYALAFISYAVMSTIRNTEMAGVEQFKSYNDLLKPSWKGKIVLDDPKVAGAGSTWFAWMAHKGPGVDYLRQLAKQEMVLTRDRRQLVEWVARSRYPLAIGIRTEIVTEFKKIGAPIESITPEEGTYLTPGPSILGLVNKAPHPNAARLFINWLLTKEGQLVYSKGMGVQSARVDVPTDFLDPSQVRDPKKTYFNIAVEDYQKEITQYRKLAGELFPGS